MEKNLIFLTQNVSSSMLQNIQEGFSTAYSCLLHNFFIVPSELFNFAFYQK